MRKREQQALAKTIVFLITLPIVLMVLLIKVTVKLITNIKKKTIKKDNIVLNNVNCEIENETYTKRELLTQCEKEFMNRLNTIFEDKYIIQPQVPLRMVIEKSTDKINKYANELHKYIDFGIFNKNYELQALIELNDQTHKEYERYKRDMQVKDICKQAKIPLITFWTYGKQTNNDIKYIIEKEIENAN